MRQQLKCNELRSGFSLIWPHWCWLLHHTPHCVSTVLLCRLSLSWRSQGFTFTPYILLEKRGFFFFLIIESYKRKSEKVFLIGSLNRYIVMSHCISLFAMFAYTWTSYCKDNGICQLAWPGAEGGLNSI